MYPSRILAAASMQKAKAIASGPMRLHRWYLLAVICCWTVGGFTCAEDAHGQPAASAADPKSAAARLLDGPRPAADDKAYGHALIETARAVGRQGDLQTALELLSTALDHYRSGPLAGEHRAILTAQLGISSAAWQLGEYALVIEHAGELLRLPSDGQDERQRNAARQLLAKALRQTGQLGRALEVTKELAGSSAAARGLAAEHALAIGGAALRGQQHEVATEAYRFYLAQQPEGLRADEATLGLAWAAALGADTPEQAEQQLAAFVAAHPQHHEIPHVLRAQAQLLRQIGRDDQADQLALQVLAEHADSDAAGGVLEDYVLAHAAPWPEPVQRGWLNRLTFQHAAAAAGGSLESGHAPLPTQVSKALLVGALDSGDDAIWQATRDFLLDSDRDGSQSTALLNQLAEPPTAHVAEHLAVDLLGSLIEPTRQGAGGASGTGDELQNLAGQADVSRERAVIPAACEAACRWAGLSGHWTMLALVAEQSHVATEPLGAGVAARRRLAIDRVLAESLMQTHRPGEALAWWEAIIDQQGASDFPTLLRGAEATLAHGTIDRAATRLEAAVAAAGEDPMNLALVRMLQAELAIRRARLDEARDLLSTVVRSADSAAELRPRAQWLIGETYFLQARYADAIDAYRRVDALDLHGQWGAAALLQAGKAFEKLGSSRDAATCYTALLSRFGDNPNATHARTRLAQIGGAAETPLRR